jgi:hypothetical protein
MRNLQSSTRLDDDRLIIELCMTLDVQVSIDTDADSRKSFKWVA